MLSVKPKIFVASVILQWILTKSTEMEGEANLADASTTLVVSHFDCSNP